MKQYRILRKGDVFYAQYKSIFGWRHIPVTLFDGRDEHRVPLSAPTLRQCADRLSRVMWERAFAVRDTLTRIHPLTPRPRSTHA